MVKSSSASRGAVSVAEALPERLPLVLFLGGPFGGRDRPAEGGFEQTLEQLKGLGGEADRLDALFGPLGKIGFDPSTPGRVGLSGTAGTALFHAGRAVGLAAAVRSPKKWRDALSKASVGPIRALDVPGAAEAGIAELEEHWPLAYARKPPWLYALIGFDGESDAAGVLRELVAVTPPASLGACRAFPKATGADGLRSDVVLWIGPGAGGMLRPDAGWDGDGSGAFSDFAPPGGGLWDSMVDFQGMAFGLSMDGGNVAVEGLLCSEGTLMEGLDDLVGGGSRCAIGPAMLRRRCPVWAMSILDWGLLARTYPPVAGVLKRINQEWGNLFQFRGAGERVNGVVAFGVCGLNPFPRKEGPVNELDLLGAVDAFLVVELLGQALPFRLAGRVLDSVGDVVRGGLKRLMGAEEEQATSFTVAGHRFFVALRRGAMILASSRSAMLEARDMLEKGASHALPPGLLLRSECDVPRLAPLSAGSRVNGPEGFVPDELLEWMQQLGDLTLQVRRVPAGLHMEFRRKGKAPLSSLFGEG